MCPALHTIVMKNVVQCRVARFYFDRARLSFRCDLEGAVYLADVFSLVGALEPGEHEGAPGPGEVHHHPPVPADHQLTGRQDLSKLL